MWRTIVGKVTPFTMHMKGYSDTVYVIVLKTREQGRKFVGLYTEAMMFPGYCISFNILSLFNVDHLLILYYDILYHMVLLLFKE